MDIGKFYFDVEGGGQSYVDHFGVDLVSPEDARAEAFGLASALLNDSKELEDEWIARIHVRDGKRDIYELECCIKGRFLTTDATDDEAES